VTPNVIVDIYRNFSAAQPYPAQGSTPALSQVAGLLRHHLRHGRFGRGDFLHWTHVLELPIGTDLRSAYNSQLQTWQPASADTVILADDPLPGRCTAFLVVLVQRVERGRAGDRLRAYLDRMQPRDGCFVAAPACCPNPLPSVIHATIPGPSGCPCLDDEVVELTFDPGSGKWIGDLTVCSSENLHLEFDCGSTSCNDATLTATFENHGSVGPVTVSTGCSCDPLSMSFNGLIFPDQGAECDGAISVIITE
jgi:hypothetical protein